MDFRDKAKKQLEELQKNFNINLSMENNKPKHLHRHKRGVPHSSKPRDEDRLF